MKLKKLVPLYPRSSGLRYIEKNSENETRYIAQRFSSSYQIKQYLLLIKAIIYCTTRRNQITDGLIEKNARSHEQFNELYF